MQLYYELWPNIVGKIQDDPRTFTEYVSDMRAAIKKVIVLKSHHGKYLGIVTVTLTLHDGR